MDVKLDLTNAFIETLNYKLRLFNKYDLLDFFEYASVDGVGEMAGWHHHETLEDTCKVLNCFIADKNVLAIVDKEKDKVIGSFSFQKVNYDLFNEFIDNKVIELGYTLSKDYWNKGIMTSLLEKVLEYYYNKEVEYFLIRCYKDNIASKRVIEKNNFKKYKETDKFLLFYKYNEA